mgnify:CR=1 FL=1
MCRCSPWFDAGDDSLDLVVDLVDGGVVGLVVGAEGGSEVVSLGWSISRELHSFW